MIPVFSIKKCLCTFMKRVHLDRSSTSNVTVFNDVHHIITSNKNIHFEMILDVGIGEKRKETRFLI